MTTTLSGKNIGILIEEKIAGSVLATTEDYVFVEPAMVLEAATFLKNDPATRCDYLNMVTSADYFDYFEVVYVLSSLTHNHTITLKTRIYDRETPSVPSVTGLWQGADFQEREIYDLMGIRFAGHYNMKRIFLWEGYEGHPLRKDYL
ncbi:NADH-quinone oxidoreductase subunit C [Chloroflexota bacterium]